MKKFMTLAIGLAGMFAPLCNAAVTDNLVGDWLIKYENGEAVGNVDYYFEKRYSPDGRFYVFETKRDSADTYVRNAVQIGIWELANDSTMIEKCMYGNKGDVKIHFDLTADNTLVETFAYDSNPSKVYVQKLEQINRQCCGARQSTCKANSGKVTYYQSEEVIPGLGSISDTQQLVYFIGDKRYGNLNDFKAALPSDSSMIESFNVLKDDSALKLLTDEEKTAGKNGILIAKLK